MQDLIRNDIDTATVLKGAAAGLIGGLVAAFVMNGFQALLSKMASNDDSSEKQDSQEKDEPATVKAAETISENAFDHRLTKEEKEYAGPAMHYAMGGGSGAVYGALSELMPASTIAAGAPFGAAVWLLADEMAVPALGFSKAPSEYPASTHASALAAHIVYGLTAEAVRGAVRRAL